MVGGEINRILAELGIPVEGRVNEKRQVLLLGLGVDPLVARS